MIKKSKIIIGLFLFVFLLACQQKTNKKTLPFVTLLTKDSLFEAGNPITIKFKTNLDTTTTLFCIHSYSKILVEPKRSKEELAFEMPSFISNKTGLVSWYLMQSGKKTKQGNFSIVPNNKSLTHIENYLGPRSILAGGTEFTMVVAVPTDNFDNPKPDGTPLLIKHQFLKNITKNLKKTKNFITWENIYSYEKAGVILVSTQCDSTSSKEIETIIYPNNATNFKIAVSKNNNFADGNQILKINTSIIKDAFQNTVSDGTFVTFLLTNKNNVVLKTFGKTIRGVAEGQMLHPDHPDTYKIKAYITGIAQSDTISCSFKSIIKKFPYQFSNKNRNLVVGPIKSFMNQLVPNGIKVTVKVYEKGKLKTILEEYTSKGTAKFKFSRDFYPDSQYQFEIDALGITQRTKTIYYDKNKQPE
jgi:hypothetical protein